MNTHKELRRSNRILSLLLLVIFLLTTITGCKQPSSSYTKIEKSGFILNTVVTITLYGVNDESIIDDAFDKCREYELIFSRTNENSELYKLNNRELENTDTGYVLSEDLATLIQSAYSYSKLSGGAFDLTVEPVSSLWDFTNPEATIPSEESIKESLSHISYQKVHLNGNTIRFDDENTRIDLGAIAKGYIADRLKEYLISRGVESAMINLGGNVVCVGEKPNGEPFLVGIQKPFADRNEIVATMELKDKSIVSSGIYERFLQVGDNFYHHILNPKTGYPYDNNLVSVTIISDLSVDGDGLSTTVFALGLEEGMKFINSLENVDAVFITDDYKLHYSEGFHDRITVNEEGAVTQP